MEKNGKEEKVEKVITIPDLITREIKKKAPNMAPRINVMTIISISQIEYPVLFDKETKSWSIGRNKGNMMIPHCNYS